MQTKTYECWMNEVDYQALRRASMRGVFTQRFARDDTGHVKFTTRTPRALVSQLERAVDAGAASWADILGVDLH